MTCVLERFEALGIGLDEACAGSRDAAVLVLGGELVSAAGKEAVQPEGSGVTVCCPWWQAGSPCASIGAWRQHMTSHSVQYFH